MNTQIRKAAVIGAGAMGAGIAAQFANAGIPVVLLDIAPQGVTDRRALAKTGVQKQLTTGGFMAPAAATLVKVGNVDDDLDWVAEADWIVEAIIEDMALKQSLYKKLEAVRQPGSVVSSNTSTITRRALLEGMPEAFKRDFVITHFFNPPRHMQLLELVSGDENPPHVVQKVRAAGSAQLGKTVVTCRDTAGFIANRLGCYWMAVAAIEAIDHGMSVSQADSVAGKPFGVPRTGVFGLFDLVGIDLVPLVWAGLMRALPTADGLQLYDLPSHPLIQRMIKQGMHGRKTRHGFYRIGAEGRKSRSILDPGTMEYIAEPAVVEDSRTLRQLCESDCTAGHYAWTVLKRVLTYACTVAQDIAQTLEEIDTALVLGYSWKQGPFALADSVGVSWIAQRMASEDELVPRLLQTAVQRGGFYRTARSEVATTDGATVMRVQPTNSLSLDEVAARTQPITQNAGAQLWDLGDGIACLELKTRMGVFDNTVFEMIAGLVSERSSSIRALVIASRHPRVFSAGADLSFILQKIADNDFAGLAHFISGGQQAFRALKFAPFPVVAAVTGMALGGGCEILLHCDAIVAHSELNAGLPEVSVGLVPAWGGCTQMLIRATQAEQGPKGPVAVTQSVFDVINSAAISSSGLMARQAGVLRSQDQIVMNRDHVLFESKKTAVRLADAGYQAPVETLLTLPGPSGLAAIRLGIDTERNAGRISAEDAVIANALADVLTGGEGCDPLTPVPESVLYQRELDGLLVLAKSAGTRARIERFMSR
jgi:3-hydroxyacyl-CoA dehydrogenase